MKKILLVAINAKYIHSNLAVYSLKEYAAKCGCSVNVSEYTINQNEEDVLGHIYMQKPDILMFSCYIWNIEYIKRLTKEFHKLCPNVPIWLGGPEVTHCAKEYLNDNKEVKGIVIGEGEETFYKLCKIYMKTLVSICNEDIDLSLSKIPSVAIRTEKGDVVTTNAGDSIIDSKNVLDMDELPFCYNNIEDFENRIIYYESSRGCPFSCSYCLSSVDKRLRFRSLDLVYGELKFFIDNRVKQVKFVDRTFNCDHKHAMGIWSFIKEHDNGITNFHFEVSADLLTDEEINLLCSMRPGLVQLEIGVQSTNPETIKEIKRTMNLEKLIKNVSIIKKSGNIHQHLDLIAGLPYEDMMHFAKSFDDIYRLKAEQLQLGFLKVLKGSYMHCMAKEYEIIYTDYPPYEVKSTKWLPYDDLLNIKMVENMLEIHYNSGLFLRSLSVLEKCFESPFEMYLKMGQFYRDKGYDKNSYTRLGRSEIFYEFAVSVDGHNKELYGESLVYDLFVRENFKGHPSWVKVQAPYSKQIKDALKDAGLNKKYCHVELFNYDVENIDIATSSKKPLSVMKSEELRIVAFNYEEKSYMTGEATVRLIGRI